jgi:lysozyme
MKKLIIAGWVVLVLLTIHVTNRYTHIEEDLMAIAQSTLDMITKEEGFRTKAYPDSKGLLTIGVGHLIKPDEPHLKSTELTHEQVMELLRSDLKWCSEAVEKAVKVPLTQPQYDALYSLCFNIGETNFRKSTVVRRLNMGDYKGAADAILMWNKPAVLEKRRQRERTLFLSGI